MIFRDRLRVDPAFAERLRRAGLGTLDAILARTDGRVCAWSRTTDTVLIPGAGATPGFYVKRYYYPRWWNRVRAAFRRTFFGASRAHAEGALLQSMRSLGIPAVRPVAVGARRVLHFVVASVLITEESPGAVNLTTYARSRLSAGAARRAMIHELADQVAHMHDAGFAHGQLYWRNILIRTSPLGGAEYEFLDARPGVARRRAPLRTQIEDLGHLLVSAEPFTAPAERLRFLARYLSYRGLERRADWLATIRAIADSKRSHESQRIRMNDRFEAWNAALERELRDLGGDAMREALS